MKRLRTNTAAAAAAARLTHQTSHRSLWDHMYPLHISSGTSEPFPVISRHSLFISTSNEHNTNIIINTYLHTLVVKETQKVKGGKIDALFSINYDFMAGWSEIKKKE